MKQNVRESDVYVECRQACNANGVSEFKFEIVFNGMVEMECLTIEDLEELRDSIDAALNLVKPKKGGEE